MIARHEVGGFLVPAGDVIEIAGIPPAREDSVNIVGLLVRFFACATIGRVADDEIDFWGEGLPIKARGIGGYDGNVFDKGQFGQVAIDNPRGLALHLNIGNAKGKTSHGYGEGINFDAIELTRRNFDRVFGQIGVEVN